MNDPESNNEDPLSPENIDQENQNSDFDNDTADNLDASAEHHAQNEMGADLNETGEQASEHHHEDRITLLEAELEKAKEAMLRALADSENTRKRAAKDVQDSRKYAIAGFARDLLDFSDNFRRGLESVPEDLKSLDPRIEGVLSGIQSMEKDLLRTFEKNDIRKLEPMGEVFDPNFHEVMFEAPGTGQAAGVIIELVEPGYILGDRLLRPARVGVAKDEGQPSGEPAEPGAQIDKEV